MLQVKAKKGMKMFKTFKYIVYCMSGTVLSSENHKPNKTPTLPSRTYSVVGIQTGTQEIKTQACCNKSCTKKNTVMWESCTA